MNENLIKGSNCIFTMLIFYSSQIVTDYKSIYLVGCIYKVVVEVLVNMLKPVIDKVINEFIKSFCEVKTTFE